ncbi:Single-stranded DNA-binding protein 2 [Anabarilius grahami]|uniref:Single-stranded DNA-binding protein 2 n=2 Tax=Cyprinoidei TaxID=30727 RepID=A0A3N0XT96_ANAGA|nr:Single-stranded DNA-binding protein 2 [Anabarilius grahami]
MLNHRSGYSTNSSENIYTMMNPIGPGGNRPNFPMGPGPDGPMGGMGGMEPHHMNGSLGSGDMDGLPKNSPNNMAGMNNPPGTPRDDGEMGGNFLNPFQSESVSRFRPKPKDLPLPSPASHVHYCSNIWVFTQHDDECVISSCFIILFGVFFFCFRFQTPSVPSRPRPLVTLTDPRHPGFFCTAFWDAPRAEDSHESGPSQLVQNGQRKQEAAPEPQEELVD